MNAAAVGRIRSSLEDLDVDTSNEVSVREVQRRTLLGAAFENIIGLLEHVRCCFLKRRYDDLIECVTIGGDHRRLNGVGHGIAQ